MKKIIVWLKRVVWKLLGFLSKKSKIYSIFSDDGKKSNVAKRVNTVMDFDKYKKYLFQQKNNKRQNEMNSK